MSTQFRSRIKTVINYAANESATGGCCLPDGTKLTGEVTINECNRQNGFFRAGDPVTLQCPERGLTGCCCACSYIRDQEGDFEDFLNDVLSPATDDTQYHEVPDTENDNLNEYGYKDNVTQCECFNRGGNWFYGKCNEVSNIISLCGSVVNQTDVRVPAACCHGTTTDVECDNVCTAKECADFVAVTGGSSVYYGDEVGGDGALCDWEYITDPAACGSAVNNPLSAHDSSRTPEENARNRNYPCFELTTNNSVLEYNCAQKTPAECYNSKGYQYPSGDDNFYSCSDVSSLMYPPKRGRGSLRVSPPTISSSVTLPSIGGHFQGGIYMGTFMPGNPINTKGSDITRRSGDVLETVKARGSGKGTNKKKWALIYSYRPYGSHPAEQLPTSSIIYDNKIAMNTFSESALEAPTSFYDGFFNTYGDGGSYGGYYSSLFEDIRSMVFNGFNDWYVPSIDELSLVYSNYLTYITNLQTGKISNISNSIFGFSRPSFDYKNMMSSSLYSVNDKLGKPDETSGQIVRGRGYVYVQNMRNDGGGTRPGLIYKTDRRTKLTVPLVRRIYID